MSLCVYSVSVLDYQIFWITGWQIKGTKLHNHYYNYEWRLGWLHRFFLCVILQLSVISWSVRLKVPYFISVTVGQTLPFAVTFLCWEIHLRFCRYRMNTLPVQISDDIHRSSEQRRPVMDPRHKLHPGCSYFMGQIERSSLCTWHAVIPLDCYNDLKTIDY